MLDQSPLEVDLKDEEQEPVTGTNLQGLSQEFQLAKEVGAGLGSCRLLQRAMPSEQ